MSQDSTDTKGTSTTEKESTDQDRSYENRDQSFQPQGGQYYQSGTPQSQYDLGFAGIVTGQPDWLQQQLAQLQALSTLHLDGIDQQFRQLRRFVEVSSSTVQNQMMVQAIVGQVVPAIRHQVTQEFITELQRNPQLAQSILQAAGWTQQR